VKNSKLWHIFVLQYNYTNFLSDCLLCDGRALTQTKPVGDQREADEADEHHVEVFEAREDPAVALEAPKEAFDLIAPLVHRSAVLPWRHPSIGFGRPLESSAALNSRQGAA